MSLSRLPIRSQFSEPFYISFLKMILGVVMLVAMTHAHAGLKFGDDDTIHRLGETSLKGSNGEQLYIGRLTTMKSFALPYTIEDKGYVLGVVGDYKSYYHMPEGELLEKLQDKGSLPNPLPPYEMDYLDLAVGHALWIFVVGMALYTGYKQVFKKKPVLEFQEGESVVVAEPVAIYKGPEILLPTKLLPSKTKFAGILVISIIFFVIGVFMIRDGKMMGWLSAGLFGLGIPVSLLQMYSGKSYLEMDSEKFTYASIFKKQSFFWKDVEMFYVWRMNNNRFVRWTTNSLYQGKAVNPVLSSLVGKGLMLPDTYGMKAEDLADMMNEIRRRVSDSKAIS